MNDEVLELDQAQIYTHRYTQNCVCADIMERVVRIGTESLVAYEVFADSDPLIYGALLIIYVRPLSECHVENNHHWLGLIVFL